MLRRTPVNLEHDRISAQLRDRTILVTGAAGSIGAEICRQTARFRPAAIIAYEMAEFPLFKVGLEIARDFPDCVFHPVPPAEIERFLSRLRTCCREQICGGVISILRQVVPEYSPSAELIDVFESGLARATLMESPSPGKRCGLY